MTRMHARIFRSIVIVAGLFGFAGALRADDQLRQSVNSDSKTGQVTPSPGDIETTASRVFVFVDKTGLGHQHAVVGRIKEGHLHVDGAPAGEIVFDLASFTADTSESRRYIGLPGETDANTQSQVTANMRGSDVLDAKHYPTATFSVKSFKRSASKSRKGNPTYQLEGDFILHGVARRLKIMAEGVSERGYLHLRGAFTLRQTDYGIRPYTKALGAVGVANALKVYGDFWIVEESRPM